MKKTDIKEILQIIQQYLQKIKKDRQTEIPKILKTDPNANYIFFKYILNEE